MTRHIKILPPARLARLEAERITRRAEAAKKKAARFHFLYFLICEGHVKIGYGDDPYQRCRAAQVGNPFPVTLAGLATGGKREERTLHHVFRDLHVRAEWFRLLPPLDGVVSMIGELNEPHAARLWLGEWLMSFNGSIALLSAVKPHKNRYTDVRTADADDRNI